MHPPSPTRTATLRALHGESNAPIVAPAPGDFQFARMPALAPNVHPVVGALVRWRADGQTFFRLPCGTRPPSPSPLTCRSERTQEGPSRRHGWLWRLSGGNLRMRRSSSMQRTPDDVNAVRRQRSSPPVTQVLRSYGCGCASMHIPMCRSGRGDGGMAF